jgi:hypothetical protein
LTSPQLECFIADVNEPGWPRMVRWTIGATDSARTLYRRCQRVGDGQRRRDRPSRHNGLDTNASSQMSTCRGRPRWRDEPARQRVRHGRFIADVNVSRPGRDGAMGHRDNEGSARTLHRGCQRAGSGRGGAMGCPGMIGANAPCSCQRAEKNGPGMQGSRGQLVSAPILDPGRWPDSFTALPSAAGATRP